VVLGLNFGPILELLFHPSKSEHFEEGYVIDSVDLGSQKPTLCFRLYQQSVLKHEGSCLLLPPVPSNNSANFGVQPAIHPNERSQIAELPDCGIHPVTSLTTDYDKTPPVISLECGAQRAAFHEITTVIAQAS
jgi:hypothetical protein